MCGARTAHCYRAKQLQGERDRSSRGVCNTHTGEAEEKMAASRLEGVKVPIKGDASWWRAEASKIARGCARKEFAEWA